MAYVTYLDNNSLLGRCYATHSYEDLRQQVLNQKQNISYYLNQNHEIYGYDITVNIPLTKLYGFPCYVVKFLFSNIDTLHRSEQESIVSDLCNHLQEQIGEQKGYYNLRIPSHIVDLTKSINSQFQHLIFCGGTINEIYVNGFSMPKCRDGVRLFFADKVFVETNRARLIDMAAESFREYQGQYHISPVTAGKAGEIYGNWIKSSFDDFHENSVLVAQYHGEVVGYCTIEENDIAVDAILSSVNANVRGLGIYKQITATLIQYAKDQKKLYVTGTQIDNFVVQGTYNSLGMRPFCAIYNMHYDNR